MSLGRDWNTWS